MNLSKVRSPKGSRQGLRRWLALASFGSVILCVAILTNVGGCNNANGLNVTVKNVVDHVRIKKLEVLGKDGKVVLRADADENGNGRVIIYSADGEVIASLPEGIEG